MQLKATFAALLSLSLGVNATWDAYEEYLSNIPAHPPKHHGKRPDTCFEPKKPFRDWPKPLSRSKHCYVKSHDDMTTDDSEYILDAIDKCNDGGHVIFPQGTTYVIGQALNLTYLKHIDLDIQGYIQFTNDTDYWQDNAFYQVYQNATTFFQIGGEDVNIYGGGMLDGNGQVWYDLYAEDIYILRPILFGTVGLHGGSISDLYLRYSPQWYNFLANSTDVVFDNFNIRGYSASENEAKNTDGWDTYRSSNIVIQNSVVNNGDDCVSFKPNSTEVLVQNMYCNGSHGISVGSIGQYPGEVDIVENLYIYNVSMHNASNGARIKVWPGSPAALSGDLQGGGGSGRVRNVTYEDMLIDQVDYAVQITQCYGQDNFTLCNEFPSSLTISDIHLENFYGTTTDSYDPIGGYVVCSDPDVCSNITISDFAVMAPSGPENLFTCDQVDESLLHGINCTAVDSDD
ncbi:Exopolygalacturonase [Hortaea werneckii]|nr:Exopolygalacturonase [Hortaea werneckii]